MKKKTIEEINENAEKLLLEYIEVIYQNLKDFSFHASSKNASQPHTKL